MAAKRKGQPAKMPAPQPSPMPMPRKMGSMKGQAQPTKMARRIGRTR